MSWIDAEELIRAAQLEDEDAEVVDYILTYAPLWVEPDQDPIQAVYDQIVHAEEQAEKWAELQAEELADWEYEQYRRWEERR